MMDEKREYSNWDYDKVKSFCEFGKNGIPKIECGGTCAWCYEFYYDHWVICGITVSLPRYYTTEV